MKAAQIKQFGHADAIKVASTPMLKPGSGQVLVKVYASSINPVDTMMREGSNERFRPNLPATLGVDVAGIVDSVGQDVLNLKAGERVYGQANPLAGGSGAFAEFALAPAQALGKMADRLSYAEAAAAALTGVSAYQALTEHLKLQASQRILIHGGAGGIGSVAIQLAKHLGAFVATTVGTADVEFVRGLGPDQIIDYQTQRFEEKAADFDAVFDTAGHDIAARSYRVLKKGGILVSMAAPVDEALAQQLGITAITQLTRVTTDKLNALAKLIDDGAVNIYVEKTFPLAQVQEAFTTKEEGHVRGKIVIEVRKA